MEVGARIRELRNLKKLTLRSLAQKANISFSYLGDIERGRTNPSLETLKSIAEALETSVSYLLGEVDSKDSAIPTTSQPLPLSQRRIELEQAFRDLLKEETILFNGLPIGEYDEDILDDLELALNAALKLVAQRAEKEKKKKEKENKNKERGNFQAEKKGVSDSVILHHKGVTGRVRMAV